MQERIAYIRSLIYADMHSFRIEPSTALLLLEMVSAIESLIGPEPTKKPEKRVKRK
jgi:hypothetical protein